MNTRSDTHKQGKERKEHKTSSSKKSSSKNVDRDDNHGDEHMRVTPVATWKIIVLAFLICAIIIGLIFLTGYLKKKDYEEKNTLTYNGFEFVRDTDGTWMTTIQKGKQIYYLSTHYSPLEVENITYDFDVSLRLSAIAMNDRKMYITMSPEYPATALLAFTEVKKVVGNRYGLININASAAFTYPLNGTDLNLPIITCRNATNSTGVIWMVVTDRNHVGYNNWCIILEATSHEEMVRVADRLVYEVLRIM